MSSNFHGFARWWLRRKAHAELDGVHVAGLDRVRGLLAGGSVVMAANHVGWWDGPCMVLVDEATGADGRFVLDAASLVKFPFFRWLGAIPLDLDHPMAMRKAFRECKVALQAPGRAVWFFPQGKERPSWVRPLGFQRGIEVMGRSATIVPVAIAYAWRGGERPAAVLHLGPPVPVGEVEKAVEGGLAAIDRWLLGDPAAETFECIVQGPEKGQTESVWTRMLAGMAR